MARFEVENELDLRLQRKHAELEELESDSISNAEAIARKAVECRDLADHLAQLLPDEEASYHQLSDYYESVKSLHLDRWEESVRRELPERTFRLRLGDWLDEMFDLKPWHLNCVKERSMHQARWDWFHRRQNAHVRENTLAMISSLREL